MKKILFTILISFAFIGALNAAEYSCEITGDDVLYSNSDKTSYINVNINNIEDISSLRMYIQYDNKLFDTSTCQFLNYTASACSLRANDKSKIFYDYTFNKDYSLNDYPFYFANFISNDKTPNTGKTTIKVYFDDVKDKNNKSIKINECTKEFTFMEGTDGKTISDKLNIEIAGYKFDFDEETYEYNFAIDKDINSLDIKVTTPENYKYSVNGATDLNTFGNKITIIITDLENNETTYTINVIREKSQTVPTDIKKEAKSFLKDFKKYLPEIVAVLIITFTVIIIISKTGNKKMDKYLYDL